MADRKISELTAATSVAASDSLVIVQGGETRKVSPAVMFSSIPVGPTFTEDPEIVGTGVISTSKLVTLLDTIVESNTQFSLSAGTNGKVKEIMCKNITLPYTETINVATGKGFTSIIFAAIGDSVTLKFIDNNWYVMGYKGVTFA